MSDFMKWLYFRYIRPYLEEVPREDYELWFSLLDGELHATEREDLDRVLEFTAIHAFLLGLRTGAGLEALTPQETALPGPGSGGRIRR